ncbi:MAG: hypothetical protein ACYDA8_08910 [Deferrisomatales bacterium]
MAGTVNRDEVPLAGLRVISAWQAPVPVAADGTFTATASTEGAQLLFAVDGENRQRGLAIAIPGAASPAFDAEQTALALLFLIPGILAVEPGEAEDRAAELAALGSFPAFVGYLRAAMPTRTLNEIAAEPEYAARLNACVDEWYAAHFLPARAARAHAQLDTRGLMRLAVLDDADPSRTKIRISNGAFRQVVIQRVDKGANGAITGNATVGVLDGATAASWGTLLAGTFLDWATTTDTTDLRTSAVSEYWGVGIGFAQSDVPEVPLVIDPEKEEEVVVKTLVFYLLFPVIDLVLGSGKLAEEGWDAAEIAFGAVEGKLNLGALRSADSAAETTAALVDLARVLISLAESVTAVLAAAGLVSEGTATAAGLFGPAFAASAVVLAVGNCTVLYKHWIDVPERSVLWVRTSGAAEVTIEWPQPGAPRAAGTGGRP